MSCPVRHICPVYIRIIDGNNRLVRDNFKFKIYRTMRFVDNLSDFGTKDSG